MSQRVEQSGSSKRIASATVDAFPQVFPNPRNCPQVRRNLCQKAGRWWKSREEFIERLPTVRDGRLTVTTSNIAGVGPKRWFLKAMKGRRRKRRAWTRCVHEFLDHEFEHLINIGVKVNIETLIDIGVYSLTLPESPVTRAK